MTTTANKNMFDALIEDDDTKIILESSDAETTTEAEDEASSEVDELTKSMENFPPLGSKSSKGKTREVKTTPRKYVVATSKISQLKRAPKEQERDLTRTQPCHFVGKKDDGKYGCCFREECSFAHGWDELRVQSCSFGGKCFRQETDCYYIHPEESLQDYFSRTHKKKPDLPPTSENTRKPKRTKQSKADMKKEQIRAIEEIKPRMPDSSRMPSSPKRALESVPDAPVPKSKLRVEVCAAQLQATLGVLLASGITDFELSVTD